MQRNLRILIIIAFVVIVVGVVLAVLLGSQPSNTPAAATLPPGTTTTNTGGGGGITQQEPTPLPTVSTIPVVIAVQNIPRGAEITPNSVDVRQWPQELAPVEGLVSDPELVIGMRARQDIPREAPVLGSYVVPNIAELSDAGSDAAAILPRNRVAIAVPMDRLTGIAYAIQDGDYVDVIVSVLFVDVDEEFQSILPNNLTIQTTTVSPDGTTVVTLTEGIAGREECNITTGSQITQCVESPSERQRPRLVTQRTIQNAFVVHVGNFPADGRLFGALPTNTPAGTAQPQTAQQQGTPRPQPTVSRPDIITLGVTPQDAVVLVWFIEARLPITLALRSAGDISEIPTQQVSLDFILETYRITPPIGREIALEPAITSIRQLIAFQEIRLGGS